MKLLFFSWCIFEYNYLFYLLCSNTQTYNKNLELKFNLRKHVIYHISYWSQRNMQDVTTPSHCWHVATNLSTCLWLVLAQPQRLVTVTWFNFVCKYNLSPLSTIFSPFVGWFDRVLERNFNYIVIRKRINPLIHFIISSNSRLLKQLNCLTVTFTKS